MILSAKSRIAMCCAAAALTACQTVRVPDPAKFMKTPEYSQQAATVATDYPDVRDAPVRPQDVRSARQWDTDARRLQALRETTAPVAPATGPSPAEADARFEALKAKVRAYRQDDPPGGPDPDFPDYRPPARR